MIVKYIQKTTLTIIHKILTYCLTIKKDYCIQCFVSLLTIVYHTNKDLSLYLDLYKIYIKFHSISSYKFNFTMIYSIYGENLLQNYEGQLVDALALTGDEGRSRLR